MIRQRNFQTGAVVDDNQKWYYKKGSGKNPYTVAFDFRDSSQWNKKSNYVQYRNEIFDKYFIAV